MSARGTLRASLNFSAFLLLLTPPSHMPLILRTCVHSCVVSTVSQSFASVHECVSFDGIADGNGIHDGSQIFYRCCRGARGGRGMFNGCSFFMLSVLVKNSFFKACVKACASFVILERWHQSVPERTSLSVVGSPRVSL